MYLKALLFVGIVLICGLLLFLEDPQWRRALLLLLLVWSAARAYYFVFYVLEKYVDPSLRYSGLMDLLRELWRRRK
jgi:hypothetical protein